MLLVENQYFGCINYYSYLYSSSNIKLVEYVKWHKMSFLNRCIIAGSNGKINLTVPVKGGRNQKTVFSEVAIDNSIAWQKQHLRAIMSCYAKSPFFEYYYWWFQDLYNKKFEYIKDLNSEAFFGVIKLLKLELRATTFFDQSEASLVGIDKNASSWLPNNYAVCSPNIKYTQVFEDKIGFLPNLSIIDGVFNLGTQLNFLLKQQSTVLNHHFNK